MLNEHKSQVEMRVVDFHKFAGVNLNRYQCEKDEINPVFLPVALFPHMTIYQPSQTLLSVYQSIKHAKDITNVPCTFEMTVAYDSDLKLEEVSLSKGMGPKLGNELHFLKFEGRIAK